MFFLLACLLACLLFVCHTYFTQCVCFLVVQRTKHHLRELRARAQKACQQRCRKRVEKYKLKLKQNLPSQIKLWSRRENRLLSVMTGSSGISIVARLARECPDPPVEVDPDTDEESKVQDNVKFLDSERGGALVAETDDPTIRVWTPSDTGTSSACRPSLSHTHTHIHTHTTLIPPHTHQFICCAQFRLPPYKFQKNNVFVYNDKLWR